MNQTKMTVAIVVPHHNRKEFTPEEEISLRHLMHFLGKYEKYLLVPKSLDIAVPGFRIRRCADQFFGSTEAHIRLTLSPKFYKAFTDYKYILIYHLDALVFSDQLLEWCEMDLDYIGAPWLKCDDTPFVDRARVGNSGFALKKVESFLKVMRSKQYWVDPDQYWNDFCASNPRYMQYLNLPKKYLKRLRVFNGARREMAQWHLRQDGRRNSDYFWSDEAVRYYRDFKVASFETGLRFAFEAAPRLCFELNDYRLPFGCHAWNRYDRQFWEPYLLK